MKMTPLHLLSALAVLSPVPAMAAATGQDAPVAATLPNAFDDAPQRPVTPPAPVAAQAPDIARAETALRAAIDNLRSGDVDYSAFSDDLAGKIREQAPTVSSLLAQFGNIKSMQHLAQPDGVDLFRVEFENQVTEWVIGFDNDDQIAALLFRPAED